MGFVAGTWSEISLTIRETGHGSDGTFLAKFIPFVFDARVWNMCIIGDHFLIVHSVLTGVRGLLLILASASFDRFFILDEALWSSMIIILLNEVFLWSDKRVLLPGIWLSVKIILILLYGLFFYWLNRLVKLLELKHTLGFMRVHGLAQVVERLLMHTQFVRYSVIIYHVLIIYANQSRGVVILVRVSK